MGKEEKGSQRETRERESRIYQQISKSLPFPPAPLGPHLAGETQGTQRDRTFTSGPHTGWFCWARLSFLKRTQGRRSFPLVFFNCM